MSTTPGRPDIATPEDIRLLVDAFYGQVRVDPLLGGIFNSAIRDRWPEHLAKMYAFWGTVLIDARSYSGAPLRPHLDLPVEQRHFDRWLLLFRATVRARFSGPVAQLAMDNAERMAALFLERTTLYREHPERFIR